MTTPVELANTISEFGKLYTKWMQSYLHDTGTTPARAKLLMILNCKGTQTMSQLSLALEVTARSVTKLVDALEKEGLVQRLPHATDRRVTMILLTPAGVTACKQTLLQNMPEAMCEIYTHLSPKQRRDMEQSLRILIDVLATMVS